MVTHRGQPDDDVSSAPESGTVRDETSGNLPANPQERGTQSGDKSNRRCSAADRQNGDDPCCAGEER